MKGGDLLVQLRYRARVVFNDAVPARQDTDQVGEKHPSNGVLQRRLITEAKRTGEREWLAACLNIVLQQAIRDADAAYRNFFDSLYGTRADKRMGRGSNNRNKARRKVARAHAKVADTRGDWRHTASTATIRENQTVVVEDLAVSGLARTRLAKSIHDVAWGTFRRQLECKARRYGRELVVLDRWLPTSQTCSDCGRLDGSKPLSVRRWTCPGSGAVHDRDHNAAKNILAAGRAERRNACGADVRPHTGAVGAEAGSSGTPRGDTAPHAA